MYTRMSIKNTRGMTLVELLIAIGLIGLVFGGIIAGFQFTLALIGSSKAQAGALALANERMEYIRSLAYADVGTLGGIPEGPLPQNSTSTLNGIVYQERVLIQYVDAPEDGEGADDSNGILADYKLAKVQYSWDYRGQTKTISLISNIVPRGIETTSGGGTLTVNVFDASVQPVAGASVRLVNTNGTTTIDTTRFTNAQGVAMFSGAPARAGYEITVTKDDFSTDGTYTPTVGNPNPTTPPVAVLEAEVSTMNFQIDALSDLLVRTIGVPSVDTFEDQFVDASKLSSASDITIGTDEAVLSGTAGSYAASGELYSISVSPSSFTGWGSAFFDASLPANTQALVYVYDTSASTTPELISDAVLPGNSAGFEVGSIDLSSLDAATYTSLQLGGVLTTSDLDVTPVLLEWGVTYTVSEPLIANVPFELQSTKTIGTSASATPLYKYENSFATDGSGEVLIESLEWDTYRVTVTDNAYDVAEACSNIPYALDPGESETLILTLAPAVTNSLRVRVEDIDGNAVQNAEVTLSRSGFSDTQTASTCGGVFFNSSVQAQTDYTLTVEAPGYTEHTATDVPISGSTARTVVLTSL